RLEKQLTSTATKNLAGLSAALHHEESSRTASDRRARLAIIADSIEDLRQKVGKAIARLAEKTEVNEPGGIYYSEAPAVKASQVCFLYPGQGSQAVNMLRDLAAGSPWSHDFFGEADALVAEMLPQPLSRYVYPPPVFTEAERKEQAAALNDTRVAQPALGVIEVFATELLKRFGVLPARVAGHSYG